MNNETQRTVSGLVDQLDDAAKGAHELETIIGLRQNTEARIRTDLEGLIGTATTPGAKALWNEAKAERIAQTGKLNVTLEQTRRLAMACVGALKPALGYTWNSAWNAAGFTTPSLRVPRNGKVTLLQLHNYYKHHPEREVANLNGQSCTAASCQTAAQAISDAEAAANQSQEQAATAKAGLDAAVTAGRNRIAGLRNELEQLLAPDDPRWLSFGFNRPGAPSTPEVPDACTVSLGQPGSGKFFTEWPAVSGAESFRIRICNVTGDELVDEIVEECEFMAKGLPSGSTVEVTISSRQGSLESLPSAPVKVEVP